MKRRGEAAKIRSYSKAVKAVDAGAACRFSIARGRYIVISSNAKIIGSADSAQDAWQAAHDGLLKLAAKTWKEATR